MACGQAEVAAGHAHVLGAVGVVGLGFQSRVEAAVGVSPFGGVEIGAGELVAPGEFISCGGGGMGGWLRGGDAGSDEGQNCERAESLSHMSCCGDVHVSLVVTGPDGRNHHTDRQVAQFVYSMAWLVSRKGL